VVPGKVARGRLRAHVAVGVERVGVIGGAELQAVQTIVRGLYREHAGKTVWTVVVVQAQHVAHGVVSVAFSVGPTAGEIGAARLILPWLSLRRAVALAAGSGEQAVVEGVVVEMAVEGITAH